MYTFTVLDFLLTFISCIISFLIAFYAYRGYTLIKERVLLHLNIAFTLIGAGNLVESITILLAILSRGGVAIGIGYSTSIFTQIIGFLLIIYAYYLPGEGGKAKYMALFLGVLGYTLNIILIILVTFIVAKLIVNFMIKKDLYSGLSLSAFILIDFSYILLAISPYRLGLIIVGEAIRLLGFILLAVMLLAISREGR